MSLNSSSEPVFHLEYSMNGFVVSLLCLVCLWVNIMMLWTLRSKVVFRETPRFGMLFHLLLSDTLQMLLAQVLYLLSYVREFISFPLCLFLALIAHIPHDFFPLILVLMSLERFVAVCLPLRHSAIATTRNTTRVCLGAWVIATTNNLVRLGLTLQKPTSGRPSINTKVTFACHSWVLYLGPHSRLFNEVVVYSLFFTAFLSIGGSYAAVMRVARSASTNQDSAQKARTTLLLHLVQLLLNVASTFHDVLMVALLTIIPPHVLGRFLNAVYILLILLPKCVSALVYGLRDPTIRATLLLHLSCRTHK